MLIDFVLLLAFLFVWGFQLIFSLLPLGNENSTVRRLPYVTFSLIAINVAVYFFTLPMTIRQDNLLVSTLTEMQEFLEQNPSILADQDVRAKLKERGLFQAELEAVETGLTVDTDLAGKYSLWLETEEAASLREEFDGRLASFVKAQEGHFYNKAGLSPDGKWKPYQLLTYAFVHANDRLFGVVVPLHLLFNFIVFFAVGFSLEDLWGRALFLGFYLAGAVVSCLPDAMAGTGLIGASGAVSAAMGAFLVRLPKSKMKIGWFSMPFAPFILMCGKKPFGIVQVPGYIFLVFYLTSQTLMWWFFNYKLGTGTGVSYRCHIAGFVFGIIFALVVRVSQVEEKYIHPRIEAQVSFSASAAVSESLELIDSGDLVTAERKLKAHIAKNGEDLNALLALIQVYQHTGNYDQLNFMYGRLIRHHLANRDKMAALYAYDNLLSSLPEGEERIRIPVRDWFSICEYLRENEMLKEAASEFERLVDAYPGDMMTLRACIHGGEAAVAVEDFQRARRFFETAESLNPTGPFMSRVASGLDVCKQHFDRQPKPVEPKPDLPAQKPLAEPVIVFKENPDLGFWKT